MGALLQQLAGSAEHLQARASEPRHGPRSVEHVDVETGLAMWALGRRTVGHAAIQALIPMSTTADAPAIAPGDGVQVEVPGIGGDFFTLLGEDPRQGQAPAWLDQARQLWGQ